MNDLHLTLTTEAEVAELCYILTMRKFYGQDTLGYLSTIINDTITECLTAAPGIARQFDSFRAHIADRFEAECSAEPEPLWAFLQALEDDTARETLVRAFFLPLAPLHPLRLSTPKEIADAYRA